VPEEAENVLRPIFDLPQGIIGYSAVGKITADDYSKVLIPEIEARIAESGKVRLLYVLGADFEGFEVGAMLGDATFGFRHFLDFERIAVVSDNAAYRSMVEGFGLMMPAEVRGFPIAEMDQAKAWLAA
jgi:hypothetical protein